MIECGGNVLTKDIELIREITKGFGLKTYVSVHDDELTSQIEQVKANVKKAILEISSPLGQLALRTT